MTDFITYAYIDPGTGFTVFSLGGWLIAFLLGFLGIFLAFFKKILGFIKHHRKLFLALTLLVIISALTVTGVIMVSRKEAKFEKKIVILGLDGLSPGIVTAMMSEGGLPNLSRLKEKGSYSELSTTNPSQSPVAWSGFATGQNPGKNGIFDFIIRDPGTYALNLSLSNVDKGKPSKVIKSKCFWQYTSDKRVPTTIIAAPVSFPPDRVYGRMLSGMGVPDILGTEGTFSFYTTEPLSKSKDTGGKVFQVNKSPVMIMHLIGPRVAAPGGRAENVKVPFKVISQKDKDSVIVEYQHNKFELKKGQRSEWKEVVFRIGLFKKAKGICKFYLVELEPDFKLYVSPINFDPRDPFFRISYPKGYSRELADNIGLYHTQGIPFDTWAVNEKRITEEPFLEQVNEVLREKRMMLDFEFNRFDKGLLFCYFEDPDIIQHMFWRYIDPQHPLYEEDAPQKYREMIRTWYKKMDEVVGSVMDRIGDEDILIVLSDHGFDTFRRAVHINSWLRENGYLELRNPHAKSGSELLLDVDWSKTKAYAIGFGAIYINQQGREKYGIVKPGSETEALKSEIAERMKAWHDEKHDSRVVSKVYRREEIFWGPFTDQAPDLYAGFNIGYRASWQTALGGAPEELIEDNLKKWSGSHLFDPVLIPGVLFTNRKITKEAPSIYDIAPTVVKTAGFGKDELEKCDFDGEPLF